MNLKVISQDPNLGHIRFLAPNGDTYTIDQKIKQVTRTNSALIYNVRLTFKEVEAGTILFNPENCSWDLDYDLGMDAYEMYHASIQELESHLETYRAVLAKFKQLSSFI